MAELKQNRPIAPTVPQPHDPNPNSNYYPNIEVTWMRSGAPETAQFEKCLLEEADVSGVGYEPFVEYINQEVEQYLQG